MEFKSQALFSMLFFWAFAFNAQAQTIRFNEVVSSNSIFPDEDGDYPDWFELYNASNTTIDLLNWTCTDDLEQPDRWTFPDVSLSPDSYLQIWASGKDKSGNEVFRTLINEGDNFRYLIPNQPISSSWTNLDFEDNAWSVGTSGFGYNDGDDSTELPIGTTSIFLRKVFTIEDASIVKDLILDIDYDDGFVAYINGQQVARDNIGDFFPAYDATAFSDHEAQMYSGGLPDRFILDDIGGLLQEGENVFCVQAHNVSSFSSDFTIIPFLSAFYSASTNEGILPPAILGLEDVSGYHTNFKISDEGETLYLFDGEGNFIDSLLVPTLPSDVSIGIPSGQSSELRYFKDPSPATVNPAEGYHGISKEDILFSHPGGLTGPISLTLSGVDSNATIHYTLDATLPTQESPIYSGPISVNSNMVIRARVYEEGLLPTLPQTRSYVLNAAHELPVLMLTVDPSDFFDEDTGIYVLGNFYNPAFPHYGANFWEDWERPIHFALYEEGGELEAEYDAGVKIFGGWSRGQDQRSLALFARNNYGFKEFDHAFFQDRPYNSYQALVLRNSGQDWNNSMLRDATLTGLLKGDDIECQAYRPTVVYLNGEYWGIYNMREKVNEHFLSAKWGIEPSEIDLLNADGDVIQGSNEDYLNLYYFIGSQDLSIDENYEWVDDQIDMDNFALYQAAQIYFDNRDWPGNNIKFWRPHEGKWRWIVFDTDFGFGRWDDSSYEYNTLGFALESYGPDWPNPPWSTLLFRKLTEVVSFRNLFVNRFADELNSRFLPQRVVEHIDSLAVNIESEIPSHFERWDAWPGDWWNRIEAMKNFAQQRPSFIKEYIMEEFDLPAYHSLVVEIEDLAEGWVQVNSLRIEDHEWEGDYFQEVPIEVTAYAKAGFVFSHWEGLSGSSEDAYLQVNMSESLTLRPVFEATSESVIVINEINYNSSDDFDTGDWIELYNTSGDALDLSGWIMKDDDDDHSFVFPQGTSIQGKGFLILTRDQERFLTEFPEIETAIGDFDFGLSSNGDAVRVYDANEILVDEVTYLPEAPWPTSPNGEGYTLELMSPELDNSLAESWSPINFHGSPDQVNMMVNTEEVLKEGFSLISYPNPFSERVNLMLSLEKGAEVLIRLYDQNGRSIEEINCGYLGGGSQDLNLDLTHLNTGVYYAKIIVEGFAPKTVKWVVL